MPAEIFVKTVKASGGGKRLRASRAFQRMMRSRMEKDRSLSDQPRPFLLRRDQAPGKVLRARKIAAYLPLLRVVDVHLDSSTCKRARSRASQSRHQAPRVLKGSSARIVLSDIEKRSPSTTIGEWPYRAFFRLAEALEGLADGNTLSSKLEKICERARVSQRGTSGPEDQSLE